MEKHLPEMIPVSIFVVRLDERESFVWHVVFLIRGIHNQDNSHRRLPVVVGCCNHRPCRSPLWSCMMRFPNGFPFLHDSVVPGSAAGLRDHVILVVRVLRLLLLELLFFLVVCCLGVCIGRVGVVGDGCRIH